MVLGRWIDGSNDETGGSLTTRGRQPFQASRACPSGRDGGDRLLTDALAASLPRWSGKADGGSRIVIDSDTSFDLQLVQDAVEGLLEDRLLPVAQRRRGDRHRLLVAVDAQLAGCEWPGG